MNPIQTLLKAEIEDAVKMENSFTRLPKLMELYKTNARRPGWREAWFECLGFEWTCCDNIWKFKKSLRRIFARWTELWPLLMEDSEREQWNALPEYVTIFRGCGPQNKCGLSWSTSREVATNIVFLNRYMTHFPILLAAHVPKSAIVALKNGRQENEAIALVSEGDILFIERILARASS